VQLTVSDDGPGIPESVVHRLFDARVTTKPDGTGLGLPLVRMIVEAHGGTIDYASRPGQGATFTVILPGVA
jgi:two-component system, NtrC family, sensor histidine kinase HydH